MDTLTAHEHFCQMGEDGRSLLHPDIDVQACDGLNPLAALLTAGASLSGWLDDLADDDVDGLRSALEHFNGLISAGVIDLETWTTEAEVVIATVIQWGDDLMRKSFAGELN